MKKCLVLIMVLMFGVAFSAYAEVNDIKVSG